MKNYLKLNFSFDKYNSKMSNINMNFDIVNVINNEDLNISENKYIPKNNDKIFFLAGVTIPRSKIKNLTLEIIYMMIV